VEGGLKWLAVGQNAPWLKLSRGRHAALTRPFWADLSRGGRGDWARGSAIPEGIGHRMSGRGVV